MSTDAHDPFATIGSFEDSLDALKRSIDALRRDEPDRVSLAREHDRAMKFVVAADILSSQLQDSPGAVCLAREAIARLRPILSAPLREGPREVDRDLRALIEAQSDLLAILGTAAATLRRWDEADAAYEEHQILEAIVFALLEKDPARRPARAADVAASLGSLAQDDGCCHPPEHVSTEDTIVVWMNGVLARAIGERATRVVIEPEEREFVVWFENGGAPFVARREPVVFLPLVVARLRKMGGLADGDHEGPLDGHFVLRWREEVVNVEVTMDSPTRVVLRLELRPHDP